MVLRLSDSLARGMVVAAALLLGLWLSFFGVRTAIARHDSERETAKSLEAAVRLEPNNPEYWYMLGRYQQYNFEQSNSVLAENSYRKAIALNPDGTDAWLDLATAYELDGKAEEAREAYLQAKKSYPVSADVAWRYGNFLLREGQLPQAYPELRRAIEADPRYAAAAFSRAYRTNPNIDELLARTFTGKTNVYVDVIWEALSDKQLAVAKTVWARLLTLHPHLEMRGQFERFVSELHERRRIYRSRQVWDQGMATMNLPPLFRPGSSVVWDPSFETGINGYSFSWHFSPIDRESASISTKQRSIPARSRCGSLLTESTIQIWRRPARFAIVQPGTTYRFSGWIKSRGNSPPNRASAFAFILMLMAIPTFL